MLKTSNIKSMAQILRDMKNPPVEEETVEQMDEALDPVNKVAIAVDKLDGMADYLDTQVEEVELVEKDVAIPASIDNLKKIVKDKQNAVFMFKDGKVRVDLFSASALVQVYDALKPATKKKFEDMIKTKGGFVKSVDFAFSMAKK